MAMKNIIKKQKQELIASVVEDMLGHPSWFGKFPEDEDTIKAHVAIKVAREVTRRGLTGMNVADAREKVMAIRKILN